MEALARERARRERQPVAEQQVTRARGVEGDTSYKVSDALTLIAGASYLDARVIASSNAALRGTRKINIPRTSGALSARYKFSGLLPGLSLGGSLRYPGGYVRATATPPRTSASTTVGPMR